MTDIIDPAAIRAAAAEVDAARQHFLGQFLADEDQFVQFLQAFHDSLQLAADSYQQNEARNTEFFTNISKTLDAGEG